MKDNDYNDKYDTMEIDLPNEYRTKRKWRKKLIKNICFIFVISFFVLIIFLIIVQSNNQNNYVDGNEMKASSIEGKTESNKEAKVMVGEKEISSENSNSTFSKIGNEENKENSNEESSNKINSNIESSIEEKTNIETIDESSIKDENTKVYETPKLSSNENSLEMSSYESSIDVTESLEEKYADVQSVYYLLDDGTEVCYSDFEEPVTVGVRIIFNETQNINVSDVLNSFNVSGDVKFFDVNFKNNVFTANIYVGKQSSVSFSEYYAPGNLITSD